MIGGAGKWCLIALAVLAAGLGGYRYARSGAQDSLVPGAISSSTGPAGEAVPAHTVPLRVSDITAKIFAYGQIVPQPGQPRVIAIPFEAQVNRVLVTTGEQVQPGTPLAAIEASPASQLQFQQVLAGVSLAEKELRQTEQKYADHFATNSQLVEARHALETARLMQQNLEKEGVGQPTVIKAQFAGIVTRVTALEGQIVEPGAALIDIAREGRIEARLSFAPDKMSYVHPGQSIQLSSAQLDPAKSTSGRVRLVTNEINPKSELVDVYVTLPADSKLSLHEPVRGSLLATATRSFVVPSAAIRSTNSGYALFTIDHGHAVKHLVRIGLKTGNEVGVSGNDLTAGEAVVIAGRDNPESEAALPHHDPR